MSDRYFIEDQTTIRRFIKHLKQTGKRTSFDTEILLDTNTEQFWEKYEFELEDLQSFTFGLRRYPYPSITRIIEIALTSQHADEVDGAAALLHDLEFYSQQEFRTVLLDAVEQQWHSISLERYEILYERAELYDATNNREILGKHFDEIERDARLFIDEAQRAKRLLRKIRNSKT